MAPYKSNWPMCLRKTLCLSMYSIRLYSLSLGLFPIDLPPHVLLPSTYLDAYRLILCFGRDECYFPLFQTTDRPPVQFRHHYTAPTATLSIHREPCQFDC